MKNKKFFTHFFLLMACSFLMSASLFAGTSPSNIKKELSKYFEKAPWLGLIADEVTYGPIKISHVHIHDGDKFVIADPGEVFHGSLKYHIKTDDLEFFHKYHLIIGLKEYGAQECVTHSRALWNSKGKAHFKLTAPQKPGIYQVRFLFVEDAHCSSAKNLWNSGISAPGAHATIGVLIVE